MEVREQWPQVDVRWGELIMVGSFEGQLTAKIQPAEWWMHGE
jgi:hypothetical protein